eukprot:TRINITY_DN9402_c0_g1_i1.p1 TRINITY_DN9402_c0_g1~~TRINITY_DN9402_c0_g1_i1.p1  ORF type:complete len:319 (+),score=3.85 TRINITY_DN9402_c0_g1_i1:131-958(+)
MFPGRFDDMPWEPGVVHCVGQIPYLRDSNGTVIRFAYRNVKWCGQPKRMISVGDRVEFVRNPPPWDYKVYQVRMVNTRTARPRAPVLPDDGLFPVAVRMALPVPDRVAAAAVPSLPVAQSDGIAPPVQSGQLCARAVVPCAAAVPVDVSWPTPSMQTGPATTGTIVVPVVVVPSVAPSARVVPSPDMALCPMTPSAAYVSGYPGDKSDPASEHGTATPPAESEPAVDAVQAPPATASAVRSPLSPSPKWVHDPYSWGVSSKAATLDTVPRGRTCD